MPAPAPQPPGPDGSPGPPGPDGSPGPPGPQPLDPPMLPVVIGGMVVWAIAGLAVLAWPGGHSSWWWICVAGFLWGVPGTLVMLWHDAQRRRRRRAHQS